MARRGGFDRWRRASTLDPSPALAWRRPAPLEAPIRSLLFGITRFEQHGRSLAATHEVVPPPRLGDSFFPRLENNIEVLRGARELLERRAREGLHVGPAAHWLLDNASLIDEQLHAIRGGLPRSFFRLLPRLRDEPLAGLPRIYGVAWAWVAHSDSGLDLTLLEAYLRAYQQERALTLAELWALPTTLRVVLVENLRRLAERLAAQQAARDAAHQWFDGPEAERTLDQLNRLEAPLRQRGVLESFVLQLEQRQDDLPLAASRDLAGWLVPRLADAAGAEAAQQAMAAEDQQSIRNAIVSLRQLDRVDWRAIFATGNAVMQTLARSPVYAAESEPTQDETLHAVQRLARESGRAEGEVAERLLEQIEQAAAECHDEAGARSAPAWWTRGGGEGALRAALGLPPRRWPRQGSARLRRLATAIYLPGLALLTLASVATVMHRFADPAAPAALWWLTALLLAGPLGEAVVAVINRLISESTPPSRLPRMAFDDGIPAGERVLVVIPALLTNEQSAQALAAQLEQHHIASPERHAQFALLTDAPDAAEPSTPADIAVLDAARQAIETLNRRYPVASGEPLRFLLLHRQRGWSETQGAYIGWERKRGKLEQLLLALGDEGAPSPFIALGEVSRLPRGVRHLVTLDSDTDLPPGRLRQLVGVAAHPLNRPRVDPEKRRVVAGYGILQPRVVTPLAGRDSDTPYRRLFGGQSGIDPYSAATSEVYQDLFGEGTFTGKGLIDVAAARQVLCGRFPEGQVLSHDLLEGALARCAGVSDVVVVEDAPLHPDTAASRLHRWTRGDWQLLPFLRRAGRDGLPWIQRWKMADNLRRSLAAPMSLALLVLVVATGVLPLPWAVGVVLAAFGAGPLLGALAALAPSRDDIAPVRFFARAAGDLGRALLMPLWHLAQLLQLSLLYGDAIARALYRHFVSRRQLLQWTTAAAAQAGTRSDLPGLIRQHARVPLAALLIAGGWALAAYAGLKVDIAAAGVLTLLWAASPLWTWAVCRPRRPPRAERLSDADRDYLRDLARDTWRFYERHVGPADHHLPPDNVQQLPYTMVAHRTSPTNIGLYLLSVACARQFGFIGRVEMAERITETLATMDRMPRHRGHFLNWIDTRSLAVLAPAYVSSVDSGNLSACLLALARACEEEAERLPDDDADAAGRHPQAMERALRRSAERAQVLMPVLSAMPSLQTLTSIASGLTPHAGDLDGAREQQRQVRRARVELDSLNLGHSESDDNGSLWLLHDHVATLESALRDMLETPPDLAGRLRALAERARRLALAPDYAMLYDRRRRLLRIGLQVDASSHDDHYYDLLASESRLTSLIAIAKGDVPPEHWAALGRPLFVRGSRLGLKSWSGSMFEYLMPTLLLAEPAESIFGEATRTAVLEQQREAADHGTPWGASESAIAVQDITLAYQYGPQGTATLGLRRPPADERVIAPYATALALAVAPQAAVANLRALQAIGARRALGFIEALDYTPQRQGTPGTSGTAGKAGGGFVEVHAFMAHHQAMSLLAFTDALCANAPRRWAMSEAHLRAVAPLLHERGPREVARPLETAAEPLPQRPRRANLVLDAEPLSSTFAPTQLLGNGRLAVMLRSHGGGVSRWQGNDLTRWRDDLPRDAHGSFLYIDRGPMAQRRSLTAHPAPDPGARYRCRMQPDRVVFDAAWPDLQTRCTVWVSPEDDCELRQVELNASSPRTGDVTLTFAAEAVLAPLAADEAHPAFSSLFVEASWDADNHALYLRRRPRRHDERPLLAAFFLAGTQGEVVDVEPCADRARWLGRHGSPAAPAGDGHARVLPPTAHGDALPGVALDTGLDPVAVIRVRVRLAIGQPAQATFATAAAADLEGLSALVDKYRQSGHVQRASSMSHTMAGIRLRDLQLDRENWRALLHLQTLLTSQATRELPAPVANAAMPRCERRLLWRHGISGERPLLVVQIGAEDGLGLVQLLKRALRLWSACGLAIDLVVLNTEPASYLQPVQRQLQLFRERHLAQQDDAIPEHRRSALHLLRESDLSPDERSTLLALARLRLAGDGRPLALQIERWLDDYRREAAPTAAAQPRLAVPVVPAVAPAPRAAGAAAGGGPTPPAGHFDAASGDFNFAVSTGSAPARPWINVLANRDFGCHVSEVGAGMTWWRNSRMHRLSPWSNDALCDPHGEWLLLHDLDRSLVWPLGRWVAAESPREVTHGIGYTRMRQRIAELEITLTWCVDESAAIKQVQVAIANSGRKPRRLRLAGLVEWMMGSARHERLSIATRVETLLVGPQGAGLPTPDRVPLLLATQSDGSAGFGGATAFVLWRTPTSDGSSGDDRWSGGSIADWTCDRREFFDTAGALVLPARLQRRSGFGLDACAAQASRIELAAGASTELTWLMGHAESPRAASELAAAAWRVEPAERLARQRGAWAERSRAVQVQTPDTAFDALVNHWLPYQTLACRLWARAGFYQAGGAFGFRDQLQDAMSLVNHDSALLAQQIRHHAAHQFAQGDAQHWWHEPGGAGVRTHIVDDRLWLPLALALYVERSGDTALPDEPVHFIAGSPLPLSREDIYETPTIDESGPATIYEHAARAIDCSLGVGAHGLPLFGGGDWNDGMNRVGHEGRGESVWMGWFLCDVIRATLPLAEARGDSARVSAWTTARHALQAALDDAGWDGRWYRRGYFDDGTPLGTAGAAECRIDLIAQAWAVLSAAGDPARARLAMGSARELLLDDNRGLVRLLDPPLSRQQPEAGYIQGYPPGVRENGGQYNHGAVWALMALARLGEAEPAWRVFTAMSPAHRWQHPERGRRYALEPFVMAGDIYTQPPYAGRGGWSWYTGSAGWLLQAALESLLGVVPAQGRVQLRPCLPTHWPTASVTLRHGGHAHRFVVCRDEAASRQALKAEPQAVRVAAGDVVDLRAQAGPAVFVVAPRAEGRAGGGDITETAATSATNGS